MKARRIALVVALALVFLVLWPIHGAAQWRAAASPLPSEGSQPSTVSVPTDTRFEVSLDGRIGLPRGYVKVGENELHGNRLRLHEDLGIDVSEALEASAAFHFTVRDAVRTTYVYHFLDGGTSMRASHAYNGETFGPGHVDTTTNFFRVSLDYERQLLKGDGFSLAGTAGLTYVHLDITLSGQGRRSPEEFSRQELPVPILGFRADLPFGGRFGTRAFVAGGGLPRVNSLRKEGGTIYLEQAHADAGVSLTYHITRVLESEAGYQFTYFFQHEKSHEDNNTFKLIDNGFRVGLSLRF